MPNKYRKSFRPNLRDLGLITVVLLTSTIAVSAQHDHTLPVTRGYVWPFRVEVLIGGRPLHLYHARGRMYVEAIPGAEYEIRITNPLPYRVAVALSVDGLNSIDARRTSAWNASKWVIQPHDSIHVRGWQMSSSRARRFYFTSESDSYAAKLGKTQNLGVISAVFYREITSRPIPITPGPRSSDETSPRKEESAKSEALGAPGRAKPSDKDDYAATGIGNSVRNDVHWVRMDLDSRAAAEVTIRYEYYPALVRLGVIPYRKGPDRLQQRETSTGFEDRRFSPEP